MVLHILCQNIFQNRGLDTNRKWSVSQNDQNVDTVFLLWGGGRVEYMLVVFQPYIRPILKYACAAWHPALTKHQINQIKHKQRRICKIILAKTIELRTKLLGPDSERWFKPRFKLTAILTLILVPFFRFYFNFFFVWCSGGM